MKKKKPICKCGHKEIVSVEQCTMLPSEMIEEAYKKEHLHTEKGERVVYCICKGELFQRAIMPLLDWIHCKKCGASILKRNANDVCWHCKVET